MDSKRICLLLGLGVLLCDRSVAQVTTCASVDSAGAPGNSLSALSSISADGRFVAFHSLASNLVPGDANGFPDVFVRDLRTRTTNLASVSSSGVQGNENSQYGSISANGRFVVFSSVASNLVATDTNGFGDIFVRDLQAGTTELVSADSSGVQGNGHASYSPAISADGRFVVFASYATNLVPGGTNGLLQLFLRDRANGTTELVSLDSGGTQADDLCERGSVSGDGRFVAFTSYATNLVPGDTNGVEDIFVRDRLNGTTQRVSVDSAGAEGLDESQSSAITGDGHWVVFDSRAPNLMPGDTNGTWDVFARDLQAGVTERISVAAGGAWGNGPSVAPAVSGDGRYVAYSSLASNLVRGDTNGEHDVFLRDRQNGTTDRVSLASDGSQSNGANLVTGVAADGRYVVFDSWASNLVGGDTNSWVDVFVRDRDATGFTSHCDPGLGGVIGCPCANPPGGLGRGCDNFGAGPVDSGTLTATGVAYLQADSLVLTATGENNTSLTVFWTGSGSLSPTGVVHGAGVRCVTQNLRRLYTHSASGGAVSAPVGTDPSVSVRTAQVYGTAIAPGETRHYFAIYRDPQAATPCGNTSSTVNLTNAGSIAWSP